MLNTEKANKILVIRFSSLGDILLTTPFLRVLKKQSPKAQIDYLIKSNFQDAINLNPNISHVYKWQNDVEFKKIFPTLKLNNYDLVVDLQNNFRSKKIVKFLRTQSVSYKKPNIKKFLLVHGKFNLLKDKRSIPQRYLDVIPDLRLDDKGLELYLPTQEKDKDVNSEKTIGFAPGAFHFTKRWPADYFVDLGNKLAEDGYSILVFGGKSDREICKDLSSKIKNSFDLSTDNNLYLTAMNMQKCKLIVCNDSGLMHTATAVGIPVVPIFGSTVREFGFSPFVVKSMIIENNELSCRPCSHIGKSKCKKKHFKCMKELLPEMVYDKIKIFIGDL